jgi:hypothetical protein
MRASVAAFDWPDRSRSGAPIGARGACDGGTRPSATRSIVPADRSAGSAMKHISHVWPEWNYSNVRQMIGGRGAEGQLIRSASFAV